MEIVSIILRLKNQEIRVSMDEAKDLFGQLGAVLGGVVKEKEYIPYPVPQPYPVYPWWMWTRPWWEQPYQPTIIYSNGTSGDMKWDTRGNTATVSICSAGGQVLDSYSMSTDSWQAAWNSSSISSAAQPSLFGDLNTGEMKWSVSSAGLVDQLH